MLSESEWGFVSLCMSAIGILNGGKIDDILQIAIKTLTKSDRSSSPSSHMRMHYHFSTLHECANEANIFIVQNSLNWVLVHTS